MQTFLSIVAHDLYTKQHGDLSHTVVVFPSKRAGLFFNQCLMRESKGQPLFAPTYLTLDEVFRSLTNLRPDDPIRLVCLLHRIYCQLTGRDEPIDNFYNWGRLMLSDFDDIDKNLVQADSLFRTLEEYHSLSSPDEYLTKEQIEVLDRFFDRVSHLDEASRLRRQFLSTWQVMGRIYNQFRDLLLSEGVAYDGMLFRHAIEHFDDARLTANTYVFAGFNVLSKVEEQLFDLVRDSSKAMFYWDYDHYYLDKDHHEAGTFIRQNLSRYGNELCEDAFAAGCSPFDNLRHIAHIDIVSAPTDHAQASYVHHWLHDHLTTPEQETAVVLADESLLLPVLHALPAHGVRDVNVTMGFPMTSTTVFRFLSQLIEAEKEHDAPLAMLRRIAQAIQAKGLEMKQLDHRLQEEEEALYRAHLAVNGLMRLVSDGTLTAGCRLLASLLAGILRTTTIPFHGQPAQGLQVMGVLETRSLDFSHVLLLSADEGMLPKAPAEVSFIPFSLRKAFGLTTAERQAAVYAYYFYRLIQRARHVTLVSMNGTNGLTQRTPSRFITQLQVEFGGTISHHALAAHGTQAATPQPIIVQQTDDTRRKLAARFACAPGKKASLLSPSALNDYLNCRLQFYFKHIEGLKYRQEDTEQVTTAQFGQLFHRCAELAYMQLTTAGPTIGREALTQLAKNRVQIERIVDKAFRDVYFQVDDHAEVHYDGIHLINRTALIAYLRQLLLGDAERAPFEHLGSERYIAEPRTVATHHGDITIQLGGYIDRLDKRQAVTHIIDYKTGGREDSVKDTAELFLHDQTDRKKYVFQAFYYAWLLCHAQRDDTFSPALLYVSRTANTHYDPTLKVNKTPVLNFRDTVLDDFEQHMSQLIDEIFHSDVPYTQNPHAKACKHCEYCSICGRKPAEY